MERMELEKKKIYMDRMKYRASTQIALEDDRNLQDNKPDITQILGQKGYIRLEELKPAADHVTMKGKLYYKVLYQSDEEQSICFVDGNIPFEEQVYMEGVRPEDLVQARWELEDMTIGMINSRKLSIQAVAAFRLFVEELYEEELPIGLAEGQDSEKGQLQCLKRTMDVAGISVLKKDIFRIREEMELPQNCPNIAELIWDEIEIAEMEFKPVEEKIFVKGEMKAFFLYEPQSDNRQAQVFSTVVPINGSIDCQGCSEELIADICYQVGQQEIEVHEDFDGEQRIISLEMVLDLYIKLYKEEKVEILGDCYGLFKEAAIQTRESEYKTMFMRSSGKCKLAGEAPAEGIPESAKLLHSTAVIQKEEEQLTEKGIEVLGVAETNFLLRDEMDGRFYRIYASIPFRYLLESPGTSAGGCGITIEMESLNAVRNGENWEIKAVLSFGMSAFRTAKEVVIQEIELHEPDAGSYKKAPSMVGYVVRPGDCLWDIGKRYMVSMENLREMNHLTKEEIKPGSKILIVK